MALDLGTAQASKPGWPDHTIARLLTLVLPEAVAILKIARKTVYGRVIVNTLTAAKILHQSTKGAGLGYIVAIDKGFNGFT